jgi:hypothetical protein
VKLILLTLKIKQKTREIAKTVNSLQVFPTPCALRKMLL